MITIGRPVTTLIAANSARPAKVKVDLVARQEPLTVAGQSIAGYTLNGTSPGRRSPPLRGIWWRCI